MSPWYSKSIPATHEINNKKLPLLVLPFMHLQKVRNFVKETLLKKGLEINLPENMSKKWTFSAERPRDKFNSKTQTKKEHRPNWCDILRTMPKRQLSRRLCWWDRTQFIKKGHRQFWTKQTVPCTIRN